MGTGTEGERIGIELGIGMGIGIGIEIGIRRRVWELGIGIASRSMSIDITQ